MERIQRKCVLSCLFVVLTLVLALTQIPSGIHYKVNVVFPIHLSHDIRV